MTSTAAREVGYATVASAAVQRARRLLLACQDREGWWPDRAAAAITVAAEGLLARHMLAIRTVEATTGAARQIRSAQRPDGSWAGGEPGPAADLSASVLCYLALRLADDSPDAYHMAAAAGWIRDSGGVDAVGVTARAWLAIFGLARWASVPVPAPDISALLPRASRELCTCSPVTAVTLAVLGALRPAGPPPAQLTELRAVGQKIGLAGRPPGAEIAPGKARAAARQAALQRCGRWLADWQLHADDADAGRPPWPLSLVALHALGYPASHPAQAAGLARLDEACGRPGRSGPGLPPVAHTALAVDALSAAGLPDDYPALLAAGRWLLRQRIQVAPPGAAAHAGPKPCGWSFCPDGFPRPADTARVLIALSGVDLRAVAGWPVAEDAARWLAGTQGRDGGWAGSAALTAYCVRALASLPLRQAPVARAIRRGVIWLLRSQLPLGAWPGRDGGSDLLATTVALPALRAAGVLPGKPSVTGAVGWLLAEQNGDGGWHPGEISGPRRPRGSDAVGTAHALAALLAAGGDIGTGVDAAAGWLIRAQLPDGGWAAPVAAAYPPTCRRRLPAAEHSPVDGVLQPLVALGHYATLAGAVH